MIWSVKTLLLALALVASAPLFADDTTPKKVKESDEIILEDSNYDVSKLKKYGRAEDVVNAIQRDPFYRLLDGLDDKETSITDYNLTDFILVGTVWDIPKPLAMFRISKNKKYVVRVGDKIGRNGGKVLSIDKGEVLIREFYVDINKNKTEKTTIKKVEKPV